MTKSDAHITFMTDENSLPTVRVADGTVWLAFGNGATRVSVAVTPEQASELAAAIVMDVYASANEVAA